MLLASFNLCAQLHVSWPTTESPEQVITANVFTDSVDLNIYVGAELDYNDIAGIKAILGYDFRCEGDDIMFMNKNQMVSASPDVMFVSLRFPTVAATNWNNWPTGPKTCVMNWKASGIRTKTSGGSNIAFTVSGGGSGINFNYSPTVAAMVEEKSIGPAAVGFTMVKPTDSPGSFCEGNF